MEPVSAASPSVVVRTGSPVSAILHQKFLSLTSEWTELAGDDFTTAVEWQTILTDAAAAGFKLELNWHDECAIFTRDTDAGPVAVLCARDWREEFHVSVSGETAKGASAALKAFGVFLPPIMNDEQDTVNMTFWSFHPMYGGQSYNRKLPRLSWSTVERNYPQALRPQLANLCALETQPSGGRLMVFHGPAGTGKTKYLQTLATEWSSFADIHYVVDPDMMFQEAQYLTKVMLADAYEDRERWRLVVVEDGDEFIAKNAKARSGHSIARLLNVADGLVGQGLKVMVLVSTNVRNTQFNQAVIRPGRCGANIEFPPFQPAEAVEWCAANGVQDVPAFAEPVTLARLYGLTGGTDAQV